MGICPSVSDCLPSISKNNTSPPKHFRDATFHLKALQKAAALHQEVSLLFQKSAQNPAPYPVTLGFPNEVFPTSLTCQSPGAYTLEQFTKYNQEQ